MMFRHWRIQISLICFTLFLAVIMFWVRSYNCDDTLACTFTSQNEYILRSVLGEVVLLRFDTHGAKGLPLLKFASEQFTDEFKREYFFQKKDDTSAFGFHSGHFVNGRRIAMPFWFVSISFALLCGLPWYWRRFNFSLRTFLIAFTVLAVLLGFIGWLLRYWSCGLPSLCVLSPRRWVSLCRFRVAVS
jgi:hypothetical protein